MLMNVTDSANATAGTAAPILLQGTMFGGVKSDIDGTGSGDCADAQGGCAAWVDDSAQIGIPLCTAEASVEFMRESCAKTCGYCNKDGPEPGPLPLPGSADPTLSRPPPEPPNVHRQSRG